MKYLTKAVLLCSIGSGLLNKSFSQTSFLFKHIPDSTHCSIEEISRVFTQTEGSTITIHFSSSFSFSGTITSSVHKFTNLRNVMVESSNYKGAVFSVAQRTADEEEEVPLYSGRILSNKHDDGLELRRNEDGLYYLKKIRVTNSLTD